MKLNACVHEQYVEKVPPKICVHIRLEAQFTTLKANTKPIEKCVCEVACIKEALL